MRWFCLSLLVLLCAWSSCVDRVSCVGLNRAETIEAYASFGSAAGDRITDVQFYHYTGSESYGKPGPAVIVKLLWVARSAAGANRNIELHYHLEDNMKLAAAHLYDDAGNSYGKIYESGQPRNNKAGHILEIAKAVANGVNSGLYAKVTAGNLKSHAKGTYYFVAPATGITAQGYKADVKNDGVWDKLLQTGEHTQAHRQRRIRRIRKAQHL